MDRRHARIKRVRVKVATGAVAVFLATLGAVAAFGRQPATKVAHASTATGATATQTQTQTYDDDGSYSEDGGSSQTYSPTPMTTRSS